MAERSTLRAMSGSDRRWRIIVLVALILIFLLLTFSSTVQLITTFGNRSVGTGNRVVECTTLAHVAPEVHLPQCEETTP